MENNKKFYKFLCNNCGFDARKDTYYKGNKIDYIVDAIDSIYSKVS